MNVLELFAGIGGIGKGLEASGMTIIGQVEIDDYCQKVLTKHWPDVPKWRDIIEFNNRIEKGEIDIAADLICGGFPCTDISIAGKTAGIRGEHSGLWWEMLRTIRLVRPKHFIVENVANLIGWFDVTPGLPPHPPEVEGEEWEMETEQYQGIAPILGGIQESRYDSEWDGIPAEAVFSPQRRDRTFIVAHTKCRGWGEGSEQERWEEGAETIGHLGTGFEGRECELANTKGESSNGCDNNSRVCSCAEQVSKSGNGGGEESVANSKMLNGKRPLTERDCSRRPEEEVGNGSCSQGKLARANIEGLGGSEKTRDTCRCGEGKDEHLGRLCKLCRGASSNVKPTMGGNLARISAGMDGFGWPAGPNNPQHPWEPPRVSTGKGKRKDRLKALGNAVVPQVAELIGRMIMESD